MGQCVRDSPLVVWSVVYQYTERVESAHKERFIVTGDQKPKKVLQTGHFCFGMAIMDQIFDILLKSNSVQLINNYFQAEEKPTGFSSPSLHVYVPHSV